MARGVNVIVIVYRQVLIKHSSCARGMLDTVSWHSGTALARNGVEVFIHPPSICAWADIGFRPRHRPSSTSPESVGGPSFILL